MTEGVTNATSGFVMGTGISLLSGNDLKTAFCDGGQGALFGGCMGLISGTVSGFDYAKENNVNPWSGKVSLRRQDIQWPPNNGVVGDETQIILEPGKRISRYGNRKGCYAAADGTPIENRSLPLGSETLQHNIYEVVNPLPTNQGTTAPWFGQPGGGTQYRFNNNIQYLLKKGFIKQLK